MNADDLQDLYDSLRGSRSALAVLDARGLYLEKDMQRAHAKLVEAHATYQESRTRLLKQDADKQFAGQKDADRQIRRLKRKQEKAREILEAFDDLIKQLERNAQREAATRKATPEIAEEPRPKTAKQPDEPKQLESPPELVTAADAVPEPETDSANADEAADVRLNVARPASVSETFLDEFQENWGDDQLDVIGRNYAFLPVESEEEIFGNTLYFIRKGDESYLVFTPPLEEMVDSITLINVVSRKQLSPITREVFVQLGLQRKMVLLLDKANPMTSPPEQDAEPESENASGSDQQAPASQPAEEHEDQATELEPERQILDMGAFSQLMDSAQRSGLVPGADQIGYVRDREFRKGNYDLALQVIEGLNAKFTANAAARSQRLRQEEAGIAAGRIKISPKDLQAKRARDRAQDQAVERARSRFNRVLDGLRILMNV